MSVNRNEAIWSYSNTGTRMHAFVQTSREGYKRALCRESIKVSSTLAFYGRDLAYLVCARCSKLAEAMWDRAEAFNRVVLDFLDGRRSSEAGLEALDACAQRT